MPRNQRSSRIRGNGDYTVATKAIKNPLARVESKIDHLESKLVRDLISKSRAAETVGRTLGNFAGQGDLGALAGSQLAKFFGHGDYSVKSNSLMKGAPVRGNSFGSGKRGTRFTEREYLGDIVSGPLTSGSTDFSVQNFPLNPTNLVTFPWLARVASLYDQWEPNGIVFEFISTSSEFNGASQALGAVIMATDYDGYDPTYISKQEMENADYACSTKPSGNLVHGIECAQRERPTPIMYTSTTNGAPITSTTLGALQVATQGCSAPNVTLGELWVSYDLTFYKKQLTDTAPVVPTLSRGGTTTMGGPLVPDQAFGGVDHIITMSTEIGTGTTIHLNNSALARRYLVRLANFAVANTGDASMVGQVFSLTNANLVRTHESGFGNGFYDYDTVVDTQSLNATVHFGLNTRITGTFRLHVTEVSADY
jgi:hypothetical protein